MEYKKQHYIPQSYLKVWIDPLNPPFVWVIDKDRLDIKKKSPKSILYEIDYYTVEDESGERDVTIEKILSVIESNFIQVRDGKVISEESLDEKERSDLLTFVAAMRSRTPTIGDRWQSIWGEILSTMEKNEIHLVDEDYEPEDPRLLSGINSNKGSIMTIDEVKDIVNNPITTHLGHSIQTQLEEFVRFDKAVLYTDSSPDFITSDNPVVWADPAVSRLPKHKRSVGLRNRTIEITMPISPHHLLFLNKYGFNGYINLMDYPIESRIETVQNANRRTFAFANKYVVTNKNHINWNWIK